MSAELSLGPVAFCRDCIDGLGSYGRRSQSELAGAAGYGNVVVFAARPEGAVVVAEVRVEPPALASIWFAPYGGCDG